MRRREAQDQRWRRQQQQRGWTPPVALALPVALVAVFAAGELPVASAKQTFGNWGRAGITTTFRVEKDLRGDWAGMVEWWADWHCDLVGFESVFFYADSEYTVEFLHGIFGEGDECVNVVPAWRWRHRDTEEDLHDFILRQTNNCDDAYKRAARQGLGWLIHMDVDELFYLNKDFDLHRHLRRLEKLNVGSLVYSNLEAVSTQVDIKDVFLDVGRGNFKKHPAMFGLSPDELWTSESSVLRRLGFAAPQSGSTKEAGKREYFFSYSNGKSIVRVGRLPPDVRPENQNHYWKWGGDHGGAVTVHGKRLRNVKSFVYDQIKHATYEKRIANDVFMLHFVNVGFDFWYDKYRLLGRFHDSYMKRFPIPFDSQLGSRDVVSALVESATPSQKQEAESAAREYYEDTFVSDDAQLRELRQHDILVSSIDVAKERKRLERMLRELEADEAEAGAGRGASEL